jgi:Ca-activated chloride channel family protein
MLGQTYTPIKHTLFYSTLLTLSIAGCSNDQPRSQTELADLTQHQHAHQQPPHNHNSSAALASHSSLPIRKKATTDRKLLAPMATSDINSDANNPKTRSTKIPMAEFMSADRAPFTAGSPSSLQSYRAIAPQPLPALTMNNREHYLAQEENAIKRVSADPISTFSVDVDTAAYSNVRRMVMNEGRLPPSDAVKAEEFINYFNYDYPKPNSAQTPFSVTTEVTASPWNNGKHLLQIGLKGFAPEATERPAANLVFLIDVSGSMNNPQKLGLVKKSLRLLVNQMRPQDRIALTVYAGAAGIVLASTPGDQKATILSALDNLSAGGSTHGSAGIELAYEVAQQHFIKGGINRVFIASDGDMNVGTVNHEALKDLIKSKRDKGIALTTLGYGSGNYNYALMEQLADVGNGNAAYIDSLREAQKVLVNDIQSNLLTIAKDVKIQIEFNPKQVSEYRLIGYQNRILNHEDFNNDKVDAGDIGAGHTVTALYEIALTDSKAEQLPSLRYQPQSIKNTKPVNNSSELAFVKLRYKMPNTDKSIQLSQVVTLNQVKANFAQASDNLKFASAVAAGAQLLSRGHYMQQWNYTDVLSTARAAKGADPHGYRGEFIALIELAQQLSEANVINTAAVAH